MNPPDPRFEDMRAWLSALADGEAQDAESACSRWRDDGSVRQTWHAYHLIGDVMRSEDLAASATRDAAFLRGVRARLAAEPVVLAPAGVASRRRQPWLLPAAAAAGFVLVAGVLVVPRYTPNSASRQAMLAAASTPLSGGSTMVGMGVSQGFIRSPRLDEYLRAHQLVGNGGVAVVAPMITLRRVELADEAAPPR